MTHLQVRGMYLHELVFCSCCLSRSLQWPRIGLELDVKEILRMGRVVLITGVLQFPVCFGAQYLFFVAVESAGLKLGSGSYAAMHLGLAHP